MSETQANAVAVSAESTAVAAKPVQIVPNFDNTVDVKEYKFHFKKDDLGNKRETVELKLPTPSVEGLVKIIEAGGKGLELLIAVAADAVAAQARSLLNDTESMTAASFPINDCTWEAIANMPEAEKRGRGIAKEIWDEFAKDYVAVMPGLTGKSAEAVALAAKLFLNKFQTVKTNKPVIKKLQENLAVYTNSAANAETYTDCIKFLDEKASTLMLADETALLANL